MIVYPLSKTEARIVRWFLPCVMLAITLITMADVLDWLEGLIPLFTIGIEA
ncbi:hypothetical protein LCGC14_1557700 [marine sediment metagenome]|uniref:Uncharacterized protein n=1 Tax=marine sediment metagenome TaxID=412755 RepID=A0A0F8XXJ8_9ZZZZ